MKAKIVLRPVTEPKDGKIVIVWVDTNVSFGEYVCCYMRDNDTHFVNKDLSAMKEVWAEVEEDRDIAQNKYTYPVTELEDVQYLLDNDLIGKEAWGFIDKLYTFFSVDKKANNILKAENIKILPPKPDFENMANRMSELLNLFIINEHIPISRGERNDMLNNAAVLIKEFDGIKN